MENTSICKIGAGHFRCSDGQTEWDGRDENGDGFGLILRAGVNR